ncbi:MAG: hypothetical protein [Bacteriophage sp.]|nr:MAG: hypothetical protein [Bacteriophage sp.]
MLKSYSFYSDNVNKGKIALLKSKAILIRDFKNLVSSFIFNTYMNEKIYLSKKLSRIEIQKQCKVLKPKGISERMYNAAILEVITIYNNRRSTCKRPFKKAIFFSKLTFSNTNVLSSSQHESIIGRNTNNNSSNQYFIKLSSITDKHGEMLNIPIKVSKKYHGLIEEYNTSVSKGKQFFTSYTVQFVSKNKIKFILTREMNEVLEFQPKQEIPIGIDVNIKHNLLSLSDGGKDFVLEHNKNFLSRYISFLKYLDRKKMNKSKYKNSCKTLSKRDTLKYNTYLRRLEGIYNELISETIRELKEKGYNTLVVEDLGKLPKSFARMKDYFQGFKVSRLSRLMRLSEIKNIFQRLCNKFEMKMVAVNPAYTSQQCHVCNHISKSNRKSQEMFSCTKCNNELNADINASINIMNRYVKFNEVNDFKNHKEIKIFFEALSLNVIV